MIFKKLCEKSGKNSEKKISAKIVQKNGQKIVDKIGRK